jgi:Copper transport outer membrane protein, MctB
MFDLRYHVASLAAVFFALVIGILVGVALASQGLGDSERDRLQENLRRAQADRDTLQGRVDELLESGDANSAFVEQTYPLVMADRLRGKKIAVLFVGSVDDDVRSAITRALSDADSGAPLRISAVEVPIDDAAVTKRLANRPFLAAYAGRQQLEELGHALGQEFTAGDETPLWNALQSLIVEQTIGSTRPEADGVVVVRTAEAQADPTASFLKGLYSGLRDVNVPAVGVEVTQGNGSSIAAFQGARLPTVDNVDMPAGKLALVVMLSEPSLTGDFGTKSSARDGLLPNVVPAPATGG